MSSKKDKYYMKKYGITEAERDQMLKEQFYCCACCRQPFGKKRFYVEHQHIVGYSKMTSEEKKKYVRGICCFVCNTGYIAKNDLRTAELVLDYMKKHAVRVTGLAPA